VRGHRVELGCLAAAYDDVSIAQREDDRAAQHETPVTARVHAERAAGRLWLDPELEGDHATPRSSEGPGCAPVSAPGHRPYDDILIWGRVHESAHVDELPDIEGLPAVWGRDLHVCPCFDGHEARHGPCVVIGEAERLAFLASWVWMWCPDVTVVSRHRMEDADEERLALLNIAVVSDDPKNLIHDGERLVAVCTTEGRQIACNSIWAALGWHAASDLAASLCEVDSRGIAIVDAGGQTSRPGVWAVGNASSAVAHLAHAAAAGTNVGPLVMVYLLEREVDARRRAR